MIRTVAYPYPVHDMRLGNGCRLAYVDEGSGPFTIVFLHGLATYSMSWQQNIGPLSKHFRCIALDLPGNGLSDRGDFSYSMRFFADSIIDFIGRLGLQNVCLAGHSMGGQIAITALLQEPRCAERLLLFAPAGFEQFNPWERNMYHASLTLFDLFSSEENSLRQSIRSSFYQFPGQADGMIRELTELIQAYPLQGYRAMLDGCIGGMLSEPVFDRLGEMEQPALVMFGERDALIPNRILHPVTTYQVAQAGVQKMRRATLKMVPQCGHFLQWEKAGVVNDEVRSWLGNDLTGPAT